MEIENEIRELVSIIVPVYNVAAYLDECVQSLVEQTYSHIEILLINDGSTDDSWEHCQAWGERDSRVRCFTKQNEGLGPTRNFGVTQAKGEYLMFVDSDDWVDKHFVEEMYRGIKAENADIAECDFYRVAVDSGLKTITHVNEVMKKPFTKEGRFSLGSVIQWKMIFHRKFYVTHRIQQSGFPAEDLSCYALEIALADNIASVNIPLYFYRKYRPGSITEKKKNFLGVCRSMQFLIDSFVSRGKFTSYRKPLLQHILRWSSRGIVPGILHMSREEHEQLRSSFVNIIEKNFQMQVPKAVLWGSYNLTKILQKTQILEDPYLRNSFASIIPLMAAPPAMESPKHRNPYREFMLRREFRREFFGELDEERPTYIILDFVEERYGVIEKDGCYLTKSDALAESGFDFHDWRNIPITSETFWQLWQDACRLFAEELKRRPFLQGIILIENVLAERYGDIHQKKVFKNIEEIRTINHCLKKMYQFFKQCCQGINGLQCIDFTSDELYITDEEFEYGCCPWHLNEIVNQKIADEIQVSS